ncbi:MAG TPA: DUF4397 domain-containing protein, partial [Parasegetibacter sp.]
MKHKLSIRIICFCLILVVLGAISCSKEERKAGDLTSLSFIHASPSSGPVTLEIGGQPFLNTPLAYTDLSGTATEPYLAAPAGVGRIRLSGSGQQDIAEGNFVFVSNRKFSLFLYDSVSTGGSQKPVVSVLADNPSADTARAALRFFQFAGNIDTVILVLFNDTDTLVTGAPFFGNYPPSVQNQNSAFRHLTAAAQYIAELYDARG